MKSVVAVSAALLLTSPAAAARFQAPAHAHRAALPLTSITVNGGGGGRMYGGVGAVLGGGGTARYLEEYPPAQRTSILKYLFKPGYGASLQILKLEIGGDVSTSDGAEPSIEHTRGTINCNAGYELAIAKQAVALNPNLKLYGLQWGAPGWAGRSGSLFTGADIRYLLDWLGCARKNGLTVSYLGGWDERDNGSHAGWYRSLRTALNAGGYASTRIVAGDGITSEQWEYISDRDVPILGAHTTCGYPTGKKGPQTKCFGNFAALHSGKPLWASELGGMSSGQQPGCKLPCASAVDRSFIREYLDARVTAELAWPAIIAMPAAVLPYQDRGLMTAQQPWSGNYRVNAETWAIAHFTQFAWPPTGGNPGGWRYVGSGSGYLQGNRADGSYVTLVRGTRDEWSTIIETTAGVTSAQRARFTIKGGKGLARKTVHVWSSNFSHSSGPSGWFVRQHDIRPVGGKFTLTIKPGFVYSLTTTSGQGKGTARSPRPAGLQLPYHNDLSAGNDEPSLLAAEDGAFELAPCQAPDGSTTCTRQMSVAQPVLWTPAVSPHPYAIIGGNWANYVTSVDVMLPQAGSAGLIGRFHAVAVSHGTFSSYIFDVSTDGTFSLTLAGGGTAEYTAGGQRQVRPPRLVTLARGSVPFDPGTWHTLALSASGTTITASVDGTQVATLHDSALTRGSPGVEVGGWYPAYFSNLSVTKP